MKVIAMADLHGILPKINKCDLVCICGDISPLEKQRDHLQMWVWVFNEFLPWVDSLDCKWVCMTPGNHDFWFQKFCNKQMQDTLEYTTAHKLRVLIDNHVTLSHTITDQYTTYTTDSITLYGTPWCKSFGNWAYMLSGHQLYSKYKIMPENVDILLTHDAPNIAGASTIHYGTTNFQKDGIPMVVTNYALKEAIEEKKPKIALCGHIHSGNHHLTKEGNTWFANVSLRDEEYEPVYVPLEFDTKELNKIDNYALPKKDDNTEAN